MTIKRVSISRNDKRFWYRHFLHVDSKKKRFNITDLHLKERKFWSGRENNVTKHGKKVRKNVTRTGEKHGKMYLWGGSGGIMKSYPHFINKKIELWTINTLQFDITSRILELLPLRGERYCCQWDMNLDGDKLERILLCLWHRFSSNKDNRSCFSDLWGSL